MSSIDSKRRSYNGGPEIKVGLWREPSVAAAGDVGGVGVFSLFISSISKVVMGATIDLLGEDNGEDIG